MKPYGGALVGFYGEQVEDRGYVELLTTFEEAPLAWTITMKYLVINAKASYSMLIGCPSLNMLGAIVSTPHLTFKFPSVSGEIVSVRADQKVARRCYLDSLRVGTKKTPDTQENLTSLVVNMIELAPREDSKE